ncbi:NUDIX domain-containing protein [Mycoplasma sp. 128]|uniref:NUDIX domain-containing protein n=1 Tax=Mycoplasma sp. 3341 TaxID=3447506 RepID=UPI003F65D36F
MKKDKLLHDAYWLSLYQTDKGFVYAQRRNVNSVAVLLFRRKGNNEFEFLIRYQPLPEIVEKQKWDDCFPCPITGGFENNETDSLKVAIREVEEEAGFVVNKNNVFETFKFLASTQANEIVFGYIFDVTGLQQHEALGDGSIFEQISYNRWASEQELQNIINSGMVLTALVHCYYFFKQKMNLI